MASTQSTHCESCFTYILFKEFYLILQMKNMIRSVYLRQLYNSIFHPGINNCYYTCSSYALCLERMIFNDFSILRVNKFCLCSIHFLIKHIVPEVTILELHIRYHKRGCKLSMCDLLTFQCRTCCSRTCVDGAINDQCHLSVSSIVSSNGNICSFQETGFDDES
ncbi:MAG: hypothetical protein A4E23_01216 [Methanomethylovorans sp. PtaU1.Bin073]|nr:MAG: hypothetical protein A4E23_01216 [Methanomethylovorans sp. PtaU1.Bin073]